MEKYELTEEDIGVIKYFIFYKNDITQWCDWKKKKDAIKREHPKLIKALRNLKEAEKELQDIVSRL